MTVRGGKLYSLIADVCAFANTNGGTLFVGLSSDPRKPVEGISKPSQAIERLEQEISNRISPPLSTTVDAQSVGGKQVLRVLVPGGEDPPYAVDENKIYVRSEAETGLAVRDEIVALVLRGSGPPSQEPAAPEVAPADAPSEGVPAPEATTSYPRTGVEVVGVETRKGVKYYTMHDLRNGAVVKNVTHSSARRLWDYALNQYDRLPTDPAKAPSIQWHGDFGLMRHQKAGKFDRYDLVQRTSSGAYRFYFGVTDDGIHGEWKALVGADEE